ncbi:MAG: hypothetical protein QME65_01875 [Candidatus Omnitrophota bacterium]|nr:hypothetical protein [Candidatus Omnitrophota bacterium]
MNNRGAALILSYIVLTVLTILGSAFLVRSVSEGNISRRYADSARAFWIAEAGLSQGYQDMINGNPLSGGQLDFSDGTSGTYQLSSISRPSGTEIVSVGNFGTAQRSVSGIVYFIPTAFQNTLSVGGNLTLSGLRARVEVYGKTRISGSYSKQFQATGWFEDKQEGVSQNLTTIKIPDYDNNGTSDEFSDFVIFGREVVQSYPPEQVVYIQNDGTVNIFPDQGLLGKKVIFVEGSSPGAGDVNIFFDASWQEEEDLTVISTGDITYVEPLQFQADARLSAIAWEDYNEASIFRSEHESLMYAHQDGNFIDILDWGSTTGNLIANGNVSLLEVLSYEKYYFSERAMTGDLPPGFSNLGGSSGTPGFTDWRELP